MCCHVFLTVEGGVEDAQIRQKGETRSFGSSVEPSDGTHSQERDLGEAL